jgi:hypothetical protein
LKMALTARAGRLIATSVIVADENLNTTKGVQSAYE